MGNPMDRILYMVTSVRCASLGWPRFQAITIGGCSLRMPAQEENKEHVFSSPLLVLDRDGYVPGSWLSIPKLFFLKRARQ